MAIHDDVVDDDVLTVLLARRVDDSTRALPASRSCHATAYPPIPRSGMTTRAEYIVVDLTMMTTHNNRRCHWHHQSYSKIVIDQSRFVTIIQSSSSASAVVRGAASADRTRVERSRRGVTIKYNGGAHDLLGARGVCGRRGAAAQRRAQPTAPPSPRQGSAHPLAPPSRPAALRLPPRPRRAPRGLYSRPPSGRR